MQRFEASTQKKGSTSAALEKLKEKLKFVDWPLREQRFVPGFNPTTAKLPFLTDYQLERKKVLPIISSWVGRRYFFHQLDSHVAFSLTAIVSQTSARDAAEGLLLQIIASQMRSEPRVEFQGLGDVAVYRQPDPNEAVAFVRKNVGISIENYTPPGRKPALYELASEIDNHLKEAPTTESLSDDKSVPRVVRFEPTASIIHFGERTDLEIEITDNYPPLELLFSARHGSYNQDAAQNDLWYFRAGPHTGSAEVVLTVVNDINLMAQARCSITID